MTTTCDYHRRRRRGTRCDYPISLLWWGSIVIILQSSPSSFTTQAFLTKTTSATSSTPPPAATKITSALLLRSNKPSTLQVASSLYTDDYEYSDRNINNDNANEDDTDLLKSRLLVKRHLEISPALKKAASRKKKTKTLSEDQQQRQAEFEQLMNNEKNSNDFWSFESLFPEPVYDAIQIKNDLYGVAERDEKTKQKQQLQQEQTNLQATTTTAAATNNFEKSTEKSTLSSVFTKPQQQQQRRFWNDLLSKQQKQKQMATTFVEDDDISITDKNTTSFIVNQDMTERVEGAVYGIRKVMGKYEHYDEAKPDVDVPKIRPVLKINADRLTYLAKKEMSRNKLKDAQALYEECLEIDPRDGRPYLGLSRIARRRQDYDKARNYLEEGLRLSSTIHPTTGKPEYKGNPYLLQALGCLEEDCGYLQKAESCFLEAIAARPSHAASYVALALLRIRKFKFPAQAGRSLLQKAAWELEKAQMPPSAHVYTTWAALEYQQAGNMRKARTLFQKALEIDPQCSAAWLQWGVMESKLTTQSASDDDITDTNSSYEQAAQCFREGLKHDKRNSRLLQAYAILETKRGNTRQAIILFEKALKANPRDAGVLQAYACYVAQLGDYESARELLERGVQISARHAPLWQAWGVLELRQGHFREARRVFQEGIWSCASPSGTKSGGHACARLWQAWGVLEHKDGNAAAARQCFHRALDADPRNVATLTAWTLLEVEAAMEKDDEQQQQPTDARLIFERALKEFPPGSQEKASLWRSYELMEQRLGNVAEAQIVYQRSMRETMSLQQSSSIQSSLSSSESSFKTKKVDDKDDVLREKKNGDDQVEIWVGGVEKSTLGREVWMMNDGSIESKVPEAVMRKKKQQQKKAIQNDDNDKNTLNDSS
eukprot:CAMPEP_0194204456 /NCGR_PEP_ID=MMETSP0156-20130528/3970_1 /TAXON_ID=33649 /ORGANISM="Thalassionema nitzschioides, Strain L26-B" /LENGTH=885 /DNA_ID=CAMNT_0038930479 /DNA_START=152 /DNA_END=2809 /DNA_ORIENTATION=+